MRSAESLVNTSYSHAEVFTSVSDFHIYVHVRIGLRPNILYASANVSHMREEYTICKVFRNVPLQALLTESTGTGLTISKPKYSHKQKVVHAVIRSVGLCVRVRTLVKNIMGLSTPLVKGIFQ